jgi:threonylcarbamoyladenosine tRNA methylthiotransferase MtaB
MKTIAFITFGCKLNFSETSTMARQFPDTEYQRVSASQIADIYVINTCAVTGEAEKKCRQAIRRAAKQNPNAQIIVTGCYANLQPDGFDLLRDAHNDAAMPKVTVIEDKAEITNYELRITKPDMQYAGTSIINNKSSIINHQFFSAFSSGDRTRSFLKVQDGCDYHCAYCTVPLARGNSRNIAIGELVKTAATIAKQDIKEIVITGVNIGDFGKSTGESFFELLKALHEVEGIERYRISSIEPNLLTDEMIDWIAASKKILPHFHIPLQSGNNRILGMMRRRYTRELFAQRVKKIKAAMPHAFIGVDIIVGFPGESIDDFEDTYVFLASLSPAYLHIFPYSLRAGTPAAAFNRQIPEVEKKRRVKRLSSLCRELHRQFYERHINYADTVLFESAIDYSGGLSLQGSQSEPKQPVPRNTMYGYTRNYLKVETPYQSALAGQIAPVLTTGLTERGTMTVELIR